MAEGPGVTQRLLLAWASLRDSLCLLNFSPPYAGFSVATQLPVHTMQALPFQRQHPTPATRVVM
jgi:hypothetical protein